VGNFRDLGGDSGAIRLLPVDKPVKLTLFPGRFSRLITIFGISWDFAGTAEFIPYIVYVSFLSGRCDKNRGSSV
jgi:hypothetical protein